MAATRAIRGVRAPVGWSDALPVAAAFTVAATVLLQRAWVVTSHPDRWWFGADAAQVEMRVLAASRLRLTLGAFSVYGWQHPGPLPFYWMAPFYAGADRQFGALAVATVAANVLGLTGVVFVLRRFGGRLAGWLAVAGVVGFLWRFGTEGLWVGWNPNLTIVPLALLLPCVAGVVVGHRWAVPACVFLASWVVQAHLGTALVAGGLVVATAAAVVVHARRAPRAWRAPVAAGLALGAALWVLPLADQVAGSHNLGTIARYMIEGEPGWGASPTVETDEAFSPGDAVAEVGLVGSLLSGTEVGMIVGPERWTARSVAPARASTVAYLLVVAANAALAIHGHRRGRRFGPALCATVVLASALTYVSAISARGTSSHHVVAFAAGVGLVAWIALALGAAEAAADRRARDERLRRTSLPPAGRALARTVGIALAGAVTALVVAPAMRPPVRLLPARDPVTDQVVAAIEDETEGTVLLDVATNDAVLTRTVLGLAKDGTDVRVPLRRGLQMTREQTAGATWDAEAFISHGDRPPGRGWRRVADIDDGQRGVTVHVRRGHTG